MKEYIPHILHYNSKLAQSCPLDFEIFDERLVKNFKANSSNPKSLFLYLQSERKIYARVIKRERKI